MVDDQNIDGCTLSLSFWDSGLWGNLKGLDGYVYDVFEEILMQDEMDIGCLS